MDLAFNWILFDFGGCLDSDGVHSRKLFFEQFVKHGLVESTNNKIFQEAYSYSDQKVIGESLIVNSSLKEMNELMSFYIAENLKLNNPEIVKLAALGITEVQAFYLKRNKVLLETLSKKYPLGIISNFSGNLEKILAEFELTKYFKFVLDSYHVGFSKPDPAIFHEAIKRSGDQAFNLCFIGDNIDRDIMPAKKLGMKTILISQSEKKSVADITLSSLEDLVH